MISLRASRSAFDVRRWDMTKSDWVMTSVWIFPGCCVANTNEMPGCRPSRRSWMRAAVAGVVPVRGRNSWASSMKIQTRGSCLVDW